MNSILQDSSLIRQAVNNALHNRPSLDHTMSSSDKPVAIFTASPVNHTTSTPTQYNHDRGDEHDEESYESTGEFVEIDESNMKTPSTKNTSKNRGGGGEFGSFDEPHMQGGVDQPINLMSQISEDEPNGSYDTQSLAEMEEGTDYNEEYVDDYPRKVGEINCLWVPNRPYTFKQLGTRLTNWLSINRLQLLAGITVSFTQISEAVTYAVIAGVDPVLAIQSAFIMGMVTTIVGGRPGMISGVSTMTALALGDVVKHHGVEYIFYTVILAGAIQLVFGALGLGVIVRLIPYSVLTGFINSMALVIFFAQLQLFKVVPSNDINSFNSRNLLEVGYSYKVINEEIPWAETSVLVVMGIEAGLAFAICVLFPRFTSKVSSPFIAIVATTVFEWILIRQMGYASPLISDHENITYNIVKKQKSTKKKKSSIENKAESPKTIGICSKSHKVIDGNFKPEPDGNYAKEGYYLFQQKCAKCSSVFVPSGGFRDDEFRVAFNTPCYVCESMNCSYYLCAFCYTDEMLQEEETGRGKRTRRAVN